jgi:hypothetical protein
MDIHTYDHVMFVTYDSSADGHYISEADCIQARLPILCKSSKCVEVANGTSSSTKHVTQLPFQQLSTTVNQANTFDIFPTSLMIVRKTADDNTISIFTEQGVTVHHEHDVVITCQGKPILIGCMPYVATQ